MGAAVAYSTVSKEFLVAWTGSFSAPQAASLSPVSTTRAWLSAPHRSLLHHQTGTGIPPWRITPDTDEFSISPMRVMSDAGASWSTAAAARPGTGALVGTEQRFVAAVATYVPAVTCDPAKPDSIWLAGFIPSTAQVYGVVLNGADGAQVGGLRVLSASTQHTTPSTSITTPRQDSTSWSHTAALGKTPRSPSFPTASLSTTASSQPTLRMCDPCYRVAKGISRRVSPPALRRRSGCW